MTHNQPSALETLLPPITWLKTYHRDDAVKDVIAGLTTAAMLIPQGMAYALLAGVDVVTGLYASTLPLVVYALLGTSRQLSLGPLAMASMLMATGVSAIPDPAQKVTAVVLMTLLIGVFQIMMGLLRLGGLVNLLSHPVVTGFTAAAALAIGASQLGNLFGVVMPSSLTPLGKIGYIITQPEQLHLNTTIVGVASIATLVLIKRLAPKAPRAIILVLIGMLTSFGLGFAELNVSTLGAIPSGLPPLGLPAGLSLEAITPLVPLSFTVALIAFMESISAAKVYARQNSYSISPSQELIAQGVSNISSSLVSGFVVGGALSRTAVNAQAGAKSPLANTVTALMICVTLLFLTGPFAYLPKPILAAIIMVAVTSLIDINEVKHLWRVKRDDLALCGVTFAATLLIGVAEGILVGVISSLLWLVFTTTRPKVATLGRLPGTTSYRCIDHFDHTETFDRILITRMDAQFFFGNMIYLRDTVTEQLRGTKDPVAVVIDASSMNALDSSAAETFEQIITELRANHVEVMISHVKGPVLKVMERAGLVELLGDGHMFYEVHDAVLAAIKHREAVESGIPVEEEVFGPSDCID